MNSVKEILALDGEKCGGTRNNAREQNDGGPQREQWQRD